MRPRGLDAPVLPDVATPRDAAAPLPLPISPPSLPLSAARCRVSGNRLGGTSGAASTPAPVMRPLYRQRAPAGDLRQRLCGPARRRRRLLPFVGTAEPCGFYAGGTSGAASIAASRVRCIGGALQRDTLRDKRVVQPVGVDDYRATPRAPADSTRAPPPAGSATAEQLRLLLSLPLLYLGTQDGLSPRSAVTPTGHWLPSDCSGTPAPPPADACAAATTWAPARRARVAASASSTNRLPVRQLGRPGRSTTALNPVGLERRELRRHHAASHLLLLLRRLHRRLHRPLLPPPPPPASGRRVTMPPPTCIATTLKIGLLHVAGLVTTSPRPHDGLRHAAPYDFYGAGVLQPRGRR